ncbi:MAG TPA: M20 aminoacylase family protein, partial [Janthinobacterium sp.]|nr:M20 aminoacylase family protein [Janthinobacterium sp.]
AHPELCYEEHRTADVVAAKLTEWGIPVVRGLGRTGLVGIIKNGRSDRAIGLRADMDALPMQEVNTFAHASRHAGKMHACGHDGHTAMLLGAAYHLAKNRHFDGTVYLIFQPAEEGGAGAREMMADGLFERFPMEAIYGMHNWPGAPAGTLSVVEGPMMASSNEFHVTVKGKGSHAAQPHKGIDPVMIAVQIAQSWQTIITRAKSPLDTAVLSITQIHAGSATNVIPDEARLIGTVRTFTTPVLDLIETSMRRIAEHTAEAFGAEVEFEFKRNYPPLVNHARETAFAVEVMKAVVGPEQVNDHVEPTMGAEDFAFFLQNKPGCYIFIGNGEGEHRDGGHGLGPCVLHNGSYDFNDNLLPIGASFWVRMAEMALPLAR